jgi:hypothetical protein
VLARARQVSFFYSGSVSTNRRPSGSIYLSAAGRHLSGPKLTDNPKSHIILLRTDPAFARLPSVLLFWAYRRPIPGSCNMRAGREPGRFRCSNYVLQEAKGYPPACTKTRNSCVSGALGKEKPAGRLQQRIDLVRLELYSTDWSVLFGEQSCPRQRDVRS